MRVLVIHGPNLNLLGQRESSIYGTATLDEINHQLKLLGSKLGVEVEAVQSNHEGELIDTIQQAPGLGARGILINPAAFGHTSVALRDALLAVALPFVEVHLSNTFAREEFRQKTYLCDIASGVVVGLGPESYYLGLRGLVSVISGS